jgi:pilus assembly protein CpaE
MTEASADKIRVLIVDDIPETRDNLSKLLYFEPDIELLGSAASGQEAVEQAKTDPPDVVLMDINMPDMDGIAAAELLTQVAPACQVIMMSVQSEADYLRRSMLAGAMDFLIKPFSGEELSNSIRRVHAMGSTRRPAPAPAAAAAAPASRERVEAGRTPGGAVLAFFSPKGGTGCTTLAVNLAVALPAATNSKVVLVDASLQFGDVGALLNLPPTSHSILALTTRKTGGLDTDHLNAILTPHTSGLRVLLAPPQPEMAEAISPDLMREVIGHLRKVFDYVVVDTWSFLNETVLSVFDLADQIYVVLTPEIPAIKNTKLLFDVMAELDYPLDRLRLLVNKVDRSTGIRVSQIEANLKHPIAAQFALDERTVSQSVNEGRPFVLSDRSTVLAEGVVALAKQVPEAIQESVAPAVAEAAATPGQRAARAHHDNKQKRKGLFSFLQGA